MNKIIVIVNGGMVSQVLTESQSELIVLDKDIDGIEQKELNTIQSLQKDSFYMYLGNILDISPELTNAVFEEIQEKKEKWMLTDPDFLQFCKPISDKVFKFKEYDGNILNVQESVDNATDKQPEEIFDEIGTCWREGIVNLDDYSLIELDKYASSGYKGISECIKMNNESVNQILAELIWESEG